MHRAPLPRLWCCTLALLLAGACEPKRSVLVSPPSAMVSPGATLGFSASVVNATNQDVLWSVVEGVNGGAIDRKGSYTAPPGAGIYHVLARSIEDPRLSATAEVTVQLGGSSNGVVVEVTPSSVNLGPHGTQLFSATVLGAADTSVTWSVVEGESGGAVTAGGLYAAPAAQGTYHVRATSRQNANASALATVVLGPPTRLAGTDLLGHVSGDGQVTAEPVDLTQATVQALVASPTGDQGYEKHDGAGSADGTFALPAMPYGPYLLTVDGRQFALTNSRAPDLGRYVLGRAGAVTPGAGTQLALHFSLMSAWQSGDDLEVTCDGAGVGFGSLVQTPSFALSPGATLVNQTVDYMAFVNAGGGGGLIDQASGDVVHVTHLSTWPVQPPVLSSRTVKEDFTVSDLKMASGGTATLSGSFHAPTQTRFNATFPRGDFDAMAVSVNPGATGLEDLFTVGAQPGGLDHGIFSQTPKLVEMALEAGGTDLPLGTPYENPFPSTWGLFARAEELFLVPYTVSSPSGPVSENAVARISYVAELSSAQSTGLRPSVGPPQHPRLDGRDLFSATTGAGLTPTLSWEPPTVGSATAYELRVWTLSYSGSPVAFQKRLVATFLVDGGTRTLRLPAGVIPGGVQYQVAIIAICEPGSDVSARPNVVSVPSGRAELLSGALTP